MRLAIGQVAPGDWIIPEGREYWMVCVSVHELSDPGSPGNVARGLSFFPVDEWALEAAMPYWRWVGSSRETWMEVKGWAPGMGDPAWLAERRKMVVWS